MTKIGKTILAMIWWFGRGTATVIGLAVLLALTVGLASTALAGTGAGARFDLGKTNAVNAVSSLVGGVNGPMLSITNQSDGGDTQRVAAAPPPPGPSPIPEPPPAAAPALGLTVRPGQPPLTVNPDAGTAKNLSADRLDGKDSSQFLGVSGKAFDADRLDGRDSGTFFSGKTYVSSGDRLLIPIGKVHTVRESCDPGDVALSGGYELATSGVSIARKEVTSGGEHVVEVVAPHDTSVTASANVTCADFPPLR